MLHVGELHIVKGGGVGKVEGDHLIFSIPYSQDQHWRIPSIQLYTCNGYWGWSPPPPSYKQWSLHHKQRNWHTITATLLLTIEELCGVVNTWAIHLLYSLESEAVTDPLLKVEKRSTVMAESQRSVAETEWRGSLRNPRRLTALPLAYVTLC